MKPLYVSMALIFSAFGVRDYAKNHSLSTDTFIFVLLVIGMVLRIHYV